VTVVGIAVLMLPGLPLMNGALVPGAHSGFPSNHVSVPPYWETMATFVNHNDLPGNVLMLPEDDFYQMPYTWYYGSDAFVTDMISRNVIDPNGQGPTPASNELLDAVGLFQQSVLDHEWAQAMSLAQALDARDLLVRGDVESNFQGSDIADPGKLVGALRADPAVRLIDQAGPLRLFAFRQPLVPLTHVVTVDSQIPDLRLLSVLPLGSALVTSTPQPGTLAIVQMPQVSNWTIQEDTLSTSVGLPARREYKIALLSGAQAGHVISLAKAATLDEVRFREQTTAGNRRLVVSVPLGQSLVADGTFARGVWGHVGNCNNWDGRGTNAPIAEAIEKNGGPNGSQYLALSASADAACASAPVSWNSGPLIVSVMVRHVEGSPPSLCVWETPSLGLGKCAVTPPLPSTSGWTKYSTVINPTLGTRTLKLFLYGDEPVGTTRTIDDYANVQVFALPTTNLRIAVLAKPAISQDPPIATDRVSYSPHWDGPIGATHVLVDGMINGWIGSKSVGAIHPHYSLAGVIIGFEVGTAIGVGGFVCLVAAGAIRRRHRRIPRRY
jgi:hypothetical protein